MDLSVPKSHGKPLKVQENLRKELPIKAYFRTLFKASPMRTLERPSGLLKGHIEAPLRESRDPHPFKGEGVLAVR